MLGEPTARRRVCFTPPSPPFAATMALALAPTSHCARLTQAACWLLLAATLFLAQAAPASLGSAEAGAPSAFRLAASNYRIGRAGAHHFHFALPSARDAAGAAPTTSPGDTTYIPNLGRDKWIGLGLAISSSLAIGTSFIITKKGLIDAGDQSTGGLASDQHAYLANPTWWAGMACMVVGEIANFAAYTFAPPILVTPLGALSVLIGAVLASFILKEELGRLGRIGCTLCLVGTLIIILNAPEDKEIRTVDEMLAYAIQGPFLTYCIAVSIFAVVMIYQVVPRWGKRTPLVYLSICSLVGSISVMSVKGFGVALKLTLNGSNQFTHPSTYCFAIVVAVCILVQMNYFNKALDQYAAPFLLCEHCIDQSLRLFRFSTNVVNPIYYVMFTTSTIFASFLLFRGFNTQGVAPAVSLLCGFVVIFIGVYLLNMNRLPPESHNLGANHTSTGHHVPGHAARPSWARVSEEYRARSARHDRTISGASHQSVLFEDDELTQGEAPGEQVHMQPLPHKGKSQDVFAIVEDDEDQDEDDLPSNDGPAAAEDAYSSRAHLLLRDE